jgi:hypothetical protein
MRFLLCGLGVVVISASIAQAQVVLLPSDGSNIDDLAAQCQLLNSDGDVFRGIQVNVTNNAAHLKICTFYCNGTRKAGTFRGKCTLQLQPGDSRLCGLDTNYSDYQTITDGSYSCEAG